MKIELPSNLQQKFDVRQQKLFLKISDFAFNFGVKIYLVGGIVRDLILSNDNFDIDILVEGDAVEFTKYVSEKYVNAKILKENYELRTAEILFDGHLKIDFASTRTETYEKKGYLPKIEKIGVSIEEDVKRRDFTINTMLISLNKEDFFEFKDILGGLNDLENKTLKVLHKKSFTDDPTRILRCLKFAVRLGFEPDEYTKNLIFSYLKSYDCNISFPRLKTEFISAFNLNNPAVAKKFTENKLYRLLGEKAELNIDFDKLSINIEKYLHNSMYIWLIYYTIIFFHQQKNHFSFTKEEQKIFDCAKSAYKLLHNERDIHKLYKFLKKVPFESLIICSVFDSTGTIRNYIENFDKFKPHINGNDLIKLGLKPSKLFNEIFDSITNAKIDGKVFTKDNEIEFVKDKFELF